jgi:hypothetical protein
MSDAPAEPTSDYPVATKLDVGINRVEDRIVLIAETRGHGRRAAWLTRRLLRLLLDRYAEVIAGSSPTAAQAPPGQRDEVLQMEHVGALEAGSDAEDDDTAERTAPSGHYLVTDARMQVRGGNILLALDGVTRSAEGPNGDSRQPVYAMILDRTHAHKILALLRDKGEEAAWDLPEPSAWTEKLAQAGTARVN